VEGLQLFEGALCVRCFCFREKRERFPTSSELPLLEPELAPYRRAVEFAVAGHGQQTRKFSNGAVPYFTHPIRVAKLVAAEGGDAFQIMAALCHDLVEDTDVTLAEIESEFGSHVALLVEQLTNDKEELKALGKTEYLRRKVAAMNGDALLIKLADRLDNISDLKPASSDDKWALDYAEQTYTVFSCVSEQQPLRRRIFDTLQQRGYHP
jgi:(p)ppGpp synthase/HD superfamily hydrolase